MKNTTKTILKLSLISFMALSTLEAKAAFWDNNDMNNTKKDTVQFIQSNGFDVTEEVADTENLKLLGEKLYIEGDKKMLLIRATNKTDKTIDVRSDVGYGTAYPSKLSAYNTGYIVVSSSANRPTEKYDTQSYNDNIIRMLNTKQSTYLSKYFNETTKIFEVNTNSTKSYTKNEWEKNKINEHNFFLVDRVDRVVDDNSFRYGLFASGFVKVNEHFYKPISYYFVIYQGEIVKLYFTNEYMNFDDFKKFMILTK